MAQNIKESTLYNTKKSNDLFHSKQKLILETILASWLILCKELNFEV